MPEALGVRIFGSVDMSGRIRGQFAVYHFEGLALGIQTMSLIQVCHERGRESP